MAEAGHCLFEFHRRVSDGLGRLASNAFSTGPSPRETQVDHSVFTSLWILNWSSCALLETNQMGLTQRECSPWVGNSHASHGGRGCQILWMDNCSICYTPGLASSVWSIGGWPWSLSLTLLSAPRGVGYTTKVVEGIWVMNTHQSHDLRRFWGGTTLRNLKPLGRDCKV